MVLFHRVRALPACIQTLLFLLTDDLCRLIWMPVIRTEQRNGNQALIINWYSTRAHWRTKRFVDSARLRRLTMFST